MTSPQNKKVAAAQEQKMKKGILTEANYSLNGNDTIVRYFWFKLKRKQNTKNCSVLAHREFLIVSAIGEVLWTCQ